MRLARPVRGALAAVLAAAAPALAIQHGPDAARDSKRFGLDRALPQLRRGHDPAASAAFTRFNAAAGKTWKLRFSSRTGMPTSLVGGPDVPRYGNPDSVARQFLTSHTDILGVDLTTLTYERQTQGAGHAHVLYRQSYKGLPVEFAAVKVHVAANGAVLGVHSSYEPNLTLSIAPSVTAAAARAAALADAGGVGIVGAAPTLVILPSETDGLPHLAWKLMVRAPSAGWQYYVDAQTGSVLLRFNKNQFACGGGTCGNVSGEIYDIDPIANSTPIARAFEEQFVYVGGVPTSTMTHFDAVNGAGFYDASPLAGPVTMSLQGPFVSVSEFRTTSAHYDNGGCSPAGTCTTQGGLWTTCSTPASVPNPYVFGQVYTNPLNIAACPNSPISLIPQFSAFQVGEFDDNTSVGGEGGALTTDDQVTLVDQTGAELGFWVGGPPFRSAFAGAEAHGQQAQLVLAAKGGSNTGYTVGISSALYFINPLNPGMLSPSHVWSSSDTYVPGTPGYNCTIGLPCPDLHGEISLFYHLNLMHDFFTGGSSGFYSPAYAPGVNSCPTCPTGQYAPITQPVAAMAHVGPDLLNAFYDPDFDHLFFGDGNNAQPGDAFEDDATVPHHEYTHYIVAKIWHLVNFGQAGTISEANADYFSATSLNDPNIGSYINAAYGSGYRPLRQLTCTGLPTGNPAPPTCFVLGTTQWSGEIHADSPFVSQTLWQIRTSAGQQCADNLQFQALLFFPESFEELYDALHTVALTGAIASCNLVGTPATIAGYVTTAFNAHIPQAVSPSGEDIYEPNGSFETATDISTIGVITATIYPMGDQDYYSFGAGPGLITASLKLPLTSYAPATYYAYQMRLFDYNHNLVASAEPPYNGIGTLDGFCQLGNSLEFGCSTTESTVKLNYNNPTPGLMFLEVVGGTYVNSPSDVNSTTPYTLRASFPSASALSGGIVVARFSNDTIDFQVNVTTWVTTQVYQFAYAQLRDQSQLVMPNTATHVPPAPGDYLTLISSTSAGGQITGSIQLVPGFLSRFPGAGTVYVEVFAYDVLGSTVSLGLSNPINLTGTGAGGITAYNNVFNPLKGQTAIIKYSTGGAGRLTLTIYTVVGERVTTLFDESVPEGLGSVAWNGRNAAGNVVASGVYIVRAKGPGVEDTQKIVVVK